MCRIEGVFLYTLMEVCYNYCFISCCRDNILPIPCDFQDVYHI